MWVDEKVVDESVTDVDDDGSRPSGGCLMLCVEMMCYLGRREPLYR
jgi:hypothetical protein